MTDFLLVAPRDPAVGFVDNARARRSISRRVRRALAAGWFVEVDGRDDVLLLRPVAAGHVTGVLCRPPYPPGRWLLTPAAPARELIPLGAAVQAAVAIAVGHGLGGLFAGAPRGVVWSPLGASWRGLLDLAPAAAAVRALRPGQQVELCALGDSLRAVLVRDNEGLWVAHLDGPGWSVAAVRRPVLDVAHAVEAAAVWVAGGLP